MKKIMFNDKYGLTRAVLDGKKTQTRRMCKDYKGDIQPYLTPREAFSSLIDKVSGKGTWESNPWVFAYGFKLIK